MSEKTKTQIRAVELKLIAELMKNSRRSDRELARAVGVSQPTVSRLIAKLEREGYIREYTMIPDLEKLGYGILAVNLFKYKTSFDAKKIEKAKNILLESFRKGPFEIIMAERGRGVGYDAVMISVHRDYKSFIELVEWARQFPEFELERMESFLVNLADEVHYCSLTFASLAKDIVKFAEKGSKT